MTRTLWYQDREFLANIIAQELLLEREGDPFIVVTLEDGKKNLIFYDALEVQLKLAAEGIFSDRLLVIVAAAYIEDQLRSLLMAYLSDTDVTDELLDPLKSDVAAFGTMLKLCLALGLIMPEWFEALKQLARLRNTFAHSPQLATFEALNTKDAHKILAQLRRSYTEIRGETPPTEDRTLIFGVFNTLNVLLAYAHDNVAAPQKRSVLRLRIVSMEYVTGVDTARLQQLHDGLLSSS
ncbi:MAG: hypothetical protein SF162_06375 [bacterium]|nr:hypothetical protein [bacterium]